MISIYTLNITTRAQQTLYQLMQLYAITVVMKWTVPVTDGTPAPQGRK